MTKLHQYIALMEGFKAEENRRYDRAYHDAQKPALFDGQSRVYEPRDDDGEVFPPESTLVQRRAEELISEWRDSMSALLDAELTQDTANTIAKADIVIDGTVIAKNVPLTNLLRLERNTTHVRTVIDALPVLDPSEEWDFDDARDCWATEPAEKFRTRKVPRVLVKYDATDKHPAQTEVWTEDEVVGTWTTVKLSGAIDAKRKKALLERVLKLQSAVKLARETANTIEVTDQKIGKLIFDYILA